MRRKQQYFTMLSHDSSAHVWQTVTWISVNKRLVELSFIFKAFCTKTKFCYFHWIARLNQTKLRIVVTRKKPIQICKNWVWHSWEKSGNMLLLYSKAEVVLVIFSGKWSNKLTKPKMKTNFQIKPFWKRFFNK